MGKRRRSRELALQALYAMEFGTWDAEDGVTEMRERAMATPSEDEYWATQAKGGAEVQNFAARLIEGVLDHREAIDALIGRSSTNWKVSRMAFVDRNILRIAVFELRHLKEIPPKVTMNEAIDIAKLYGTTDSGAFINGILDRVASRERA